jgi:hypothetical protein
MGFHSEHMCKLSCSVRVTSNTWHMANSRSPRFSLVFRTGTRVCTRYFRKLVLECTHVLILVLLFFVKKKERFYITFIRVQEVMALWVRAPPPADRFCSHKTSHRRRFHPTQGHPMGHQACVCRMGLEPFLAVPQPFFSRFRRSSS